MKTFQFGPRLAVVWGQRTGNGWLWALKSDLGVGTLRLVGTKRAWIALWPRTFHRKHFAAAFAAGRAKALAIAPLPA